MSEDAVHPSITQVLRWFDYQHLPGHLRRISQPFGLLARSLVFDLKLDGPELTVALRKLLEAKDAAVRAAVELS